MVKTMIIKAVVINWKYPLKYKMQKYYALKLSELEEEILNWNLFKSQYWKLFSSIVYDLFTSVAAEKLLNITFDMLSYKAQWLWLIIHPHSVSNYLWGCSWFYTRSFIVSI